MGVGRFSTLVFVVALDQTADIIGVWVENCEFDNISGFMV